MLCLQSRRIEGFWIRKDCGSFVCSNLKHFNHNNNLTTIFYRFYLLKEHTLFQLDFNLLLFSAKYVKWVFSLYRGKKLKLKEVNDFFKVNYLISGRHNIRIWVFRFHKRCSFCQKSLLKNIFSSLLYKIEVSQNI